MLPAKVTGLASYAVEKGCTEEISSLISRSNSFTQNLKGTKAQGGRYSRCSAALSTVRTVQEKEFPLHPPRFPACNPGARTLRLCTASKSVAHKQATAEHGIKNFTPKPPRKEKKNKKKTGLHPKCRGFLQVWNGPVSYTTFLM